VAYERVKPICLSLLYNIKKLSVCVAGSWTSCEWRIPYLRSRLNTAIFWVLYAEESGCCLIWLDNIISESNLRDLGKPWNASNWMATFESGIWTRDLPIWNRSATYLTTSFGDKDKYMTTSQKKFSTCGMRKQKWYR